MPNINITSNHGATITPFLSAFGPNVTKVYDTLTLSTAVSGVTAFVTDYTFANTSPYHNESNLFTFNPLTLSDLPFTLTSTAVPIALTAHVGDCSLGIFTGTLSLTLSSTALSGATSVAVSNPTQSISFSLTAVNNPYHGHLCEKRFKHLRNAGRI